MLKIQFHKNQVGEERTYVSVNDIHDYDSFYSSRLYRSVNFYNEDVISIICSSDIKELEKHFDRISFSFDVAWWPQYINIEVYLNPDKLNQYKFRIELTIDTNLWSEGWSLIDFSKALKYVIEGLGKDNIRYFQEDEDFISNGVGLDFLFDNLNHNLKHIIDQLLETTFDVLDRKSVV